jgi:DNA-binding XRE family transcriptional regulator
LRGDELKNWRRTLDYTQEEAAKAFDVTRATIQNWERGTTSIPKTIEIASKVYLRRWKQRAAFGPVTVVHAAISGCSTLELPDSATIFCRPVGSNEEAFRHLAEGKFLLEDTLVFIVDSKGAVLWSGAALKCECEKYRAQPPQVDNSVVDGE